MLYQVIPLGQLGLTPAKPSAMPPRLLLPKPSGMTSPARGKQKMTDKAYEELHKIRKTGLVNMLDYQAVFQLALELEYDSLADFIFMDTGKYSRIILTGKRED